MADISQGLGGGGGVGADVKNPGLSDLPKIVQIQCRDLPRLTRTHAPPVPCGAKPPAGRPAHIRIHVYARGFDPSPR